MEPERDPIPTFIKALLRPVLRFCLSHSVTLPALVECAKSVAVELASEEVRRRGSRPNVSKVSVMTGLNRRDVTRLMREGMTTEYNAGLISRVIGQWEHDSKYQSAQGKPRVLSYIGEESEFKQLVQNVSTDVSPAAILFELERVGAVERTERGLKLVHSVYIPSGDSRQGLEILSRDADELIQAVEENLSQSNTVPNLHGRTEYDNLAVEKLPEIREWIFREGTEFHIKLRGFLSRFDKDINSSLAGRGGGRIVIGTFSRMSGGEQ